MYAKTTLWPMVSFYKGGFPSIFYIQQSFTLIVWFKFFLKVNLCVYAWVQPCMCVIKTSVPVCAAICFKQNNDLYFVPLKASCFSIFCIFQFLFGCVLRQWTLSLRFFVLVVSVIYVWIFIADFLFAAMEFCFFSEFKDMNCADSLTS